MHLTIVLHHGDCFDVLKTLADNSIDSVVTDPPYELSNDGKTSPDRIAAKVMFPQHPYVQSLSGGECHLARLIEQIARLRVIDFKPSPSSSMPVGSVTFDKDVSHGKVQIEDKLELSVGATNGDAGVNDKPKSSEYLGCFAFVCGDLVSAQNALNRVGTGFTTGGFGIGFGVSPPSLPALLRSSFAVNDCYCDIGPFDDTLAAGVSAFVATKDFAVTRFDMGRGTIEPCSASAALVLLAVGKIGGAKLVRTDSRTSRLPPMLQPFRISAVCGQTNRTLAFDIILHSQNITSSGFMGKEWDGSKIAFNVDLWREVLRVLKPGAHILVFGGTRTSHRMASALEDAGFEIRDTLMWVFGTGFPKSLNVGKAIDKAAGLERTEVVGAKPGHEDFVHRTDAHSAGGRSDGWERPWRQDADAVARSHMKFKPVTQEAEKWEGWGTALKPAYEPVILAQKKYSVVPCLCDVVEVSKYTEFLLWLLSPANFVQEILKSNQADYKEAECDFVRWIVAVNHGLKLHEAKQKTVTSMSPEMASIFLNIVTSWNNILDVLWKHGSMFTTEMESKMTTTLRTLKSYILQIIPASIILDKTVQDGLMLPATSVKDPLSEGLAGRQYLAIFAAEHVTSPTAINLILAKIAELYSELSVALNENFVPPGAPINITIKEKNDWMNILVQTAKQYSQQYHAENQNSADENAWPNLSPNHEPIILARKPLEGTVVNTILKHGTGGLNIDACRVPINPDIDDPRLGGNGEWSTVGMAKNAYGKFAGINSQSSELGRFPSNFLHDGSPEVRDAFPTAPGASAPVLGTEDSTTGDNGIFGHYNRVASMPVRKDIDTSAARFYYCAKASGAERQGSKHPTIKPVALMRYLCKLITPPDGMILDLFAGSGTTGQAAVEEGFNITLIEREAEYCQDIRNRLLMYMDDDSHSA